MPRELSNLRGSPRRACPAQSRTRVPCPAPTGILSGWGWGGTWESPPKPPLPAPGDGGGGGSPMPREQPWVARRFGDLNPALLCASLEILGKLLLCTSGFSPVQEEIAKQDGKGIEQGTVVRCSARH